MTGGSTPHPQAAALPAQARMIPHNSSPASAGGDDPETGGCANASRDDPASVGPASTGGDDPGDSRLASAGGVAAVPLAPA